MKLIQHTPGALWSPASEAALQAAQTALGVDLDCKWGPKSEDAIQRIGRAPRLR